MLTMKSVQTAAPGTVEVTEIERPVPGPRYVLVRVRACGICGTDAAFVRMGGMPLGPDGQATASTCSSRTQSRAGAWRSSRTPCPSRSQRLTSRWRSPGTASTVLLADVSAETSHAIAPGVSAETPAGHARALPADQAIRGRGALAPGRGCGGVRSSTVRSGRMTAPSRYGRMLVLFLGSAEPAGRSRRRGFSGAVTCWLVPLRLRRTCRPTRFRCLPCLLTSQTALTPPASPLTKPGLHHSRLSRPSWKSHG
jgi:hypothetical protein